MEFLYLSDSICSNLAFHLKGNGADNWLSAIINRTYNIIGRDSALVFAYDEVDGLFEKAMDSYERGEIYEAVSYAYRASRMQGGFADYYNSKWFKHLLETITLNCDEASFAVAVEKLYTSITTNTLDQEQLMYTLKVLEHISRRMEKSLDDEESRGLLYRLYDTGVSAYCHIGNSSGAISYFNRCKKFAYRVGVEDYLRTLNRVVETLLDNFEWKRAKQVANESVRYQTSILKMKNELPVYQKSNQIHSLGMSKALSQQAQVYAFYRNPKCEIVFRDALSSFPRESADYRITQSYLMHYYLDIQDKDKYEAEAEEYYSRQMDPPKRLAYILEEAFEDSPIINYKYALYLFVRGLFLFEQDRLSEQFLDRLLNINETIKKAEIKKKGRKNSAFVELSGHPAEIIYKYLSLIAYDKGLYDISGELIKKSRNSLKYKGATVDLIISFGEAEYYDHVNDLQARNRCVDDCIKLIDHSFPHVADVFANTGYDDKYEELSKLLVYIYH